MAGALMTDAAHRRGVAILPVDSEHNAIHQCLRDRPPHEVSRLILTASGGPFRGHSPSELEAVAPTDALKHPTWRMGRKITIDSATLMNKGLEVIEARWLFGVPADRIDVVVHPQSVVHSMVEMVDGSILAQLGVTDMRLPIQYAFSYPERWASPLPRLDLARCGRLDFHLPDHEKFPGLRLAYRALEAGARPAGRPERGERGGGRGVPGRPPRVHRRSRCSSSGRWMRTRAGVGRFAGRGPPGRRLGAGVFPGTGAGARIKDLRVFLCC